MLLGLLSSWIFLALHVESMRVFPRPLSKKEEEECFIKMSQGDKAAKNKLIEHNLRLVAHIVKKYSTSTVEQEEMISIGTIGLIKAVMTFDYSKGAKFATYASRCIANEILMNFRATKKTAGDVYINETIDMDKDGNSLTLMDIVDDGTDVDEQVDLMIRTEQLYKFLELLEDKREKEIIIYRYGIYGAKPYTQSEVAEKLGISRSYVSRIEKKALGKLKKMYDTATL